MTITLARLTPRTIATISLVVGSFGFTYADDTLTIGGSAEPAISSVVVGSLAFPVDLTVPGGTVTAPEFIGDLTGNADTATLAATATVLAVSRTIWGQSFDGSANVSGALSGATTIVASSDIQGQTMTVVGGAVANAFIVTSTTGPQVSIRYSSSQRLDISVNGAGVVALDSIGANPGISFLRNNFEYMRTQSGALVIGASATVTLVTMATNGTAAGLRLPHGTAPTSPTNGDLWSTTVGTFMRIDSATRRIDAVVVRKNTGADVGERRRLNFIEGSNVTLTIADDGTDDEIDITIASSGGGGGGGLSADDVMALDLLFS